MRIVQITDSCNNICNIDADQVLSYTYALYKEECYTCLIMRDGSKRLIKGLIKNLKEKLKGDIK